MAKPATNRTFPLKKTTGGVLLDQISTCIPSASAITTRDGPIRRARLRVGYTRIREKSVGDLGVAKSGIMAYHLTSIWVISSLPYSTLLQERADALATQHKAEKSGYTSRHRSSLLVFQPWIA
ncbi:hypothetical protein V2G26_001336 [Clonostachys chloroleuca]